MGISKRLNTKFGYFTLGCLFVGIIWMIINGRKMTYDHWYPVDVISISVQSPTTTTEFKFKRTEFITGDNNIITFKVSGLNSSGSIYSGKLNRVMLEQYNLGGKIEVGVSINTITGREKVCTGCLRVNRSL
ncbi:hypothetical protein EDF88_4630 [Buttiauxella sp. BIGb0552]|jgi:hypothetical protein|nr:hypothetical protein EDF88_4630 [Buttiauxella sp. BIGb0552]